jgi:hypothetical protein
MREKVVQHIKNLLKKNIIGKVEEGFVKALRGQRQ